MDRKEIVIIEIEFKDFKIRTLIFGFVVRSYFFIKFIDNSLFQ